MAQGRPKRWITAAIVEPVPLGKAGISIVVWDKWGKTRRGTAVISVGGYPVVSLQSQELPQGYVGCAGAVAGSVAWISPRSKRTSSIEAHRRLLRCRPRRMSPATSIDMLGHTSTGMSPRR
jgi:hypothetical protein